MLLCIVHLYTQVTVNKNVCTALEREHNFQCIATCAICMCVDVVLHVHLQFAVEHANLMPDIDNCDGYLCRLTMKCRKSSSTLWSANQRTHKLFSLCYAHVTIIWQRNASICLTMCLHHQSGLQIMPNPCPECSKSALAECALISDYWSQLARVGRQFAVSSPRMQNSIRYYTI